MPRRAVTLVIPALMAFMALLGLGGGCASVGLMRSPPPSEWVSWQSNRLESLAGSNGWTTLIGCFWLTEGTHFAGCAATNDVVLPAGRAPESLGRFTRQAHAVAFQTATGIVATVDGQSVETVELRSDAGQHPTRLVVGGLTFSVIERGDRLALRVRDPESPTRREFKGVKYFSYKRHWLLNGRYQAWHAPKSLRFADITGGVQELVSPGFVAFQYRERTYRLDVVEEAGVDALFVIFRDESAGDGTYSAGRFLYVSRPTPDGQVKIDFNRAYTPPCGFTQFATCPVPLRQNWLPFSIRAGERDPVHSP